MGQMHPTMQAALASGRCLPFLMCRLDLPAPAAPLALIYGSGEILWDFGDGAGAINYVGTDAKFGTLSSIDPAEDGSGDSAPAMSIEINVPSITAAAELASPLYKGSPFRLWVGALDDNGVVLGEPYLLFFGDLDRPVLSLDKNVRELEFEIVSAFERLFASTEGQRLADASHQAVWPGELGFVNVTGIVKTIIWGPGDRPGSGSAMSGGGRRTEPFNFNVNYL